MKINAVEIKPGNILEYENGLWRVVKTAHTQPGKGGAYMQVELKNLRDGRKNNIRFRSAESVEKVRLDQKDFQFLYAEGDNLVFMDKETYDQVTLPTDLLGDAAAFLQDGMDVVMEMYDDEALSVALPDQIEAMIVEADAVVAQFPAVKKAQVLAECSEPGASVDADASAHIVSVGARIKF